MFKKILKYTGRGLSAAVLCAASLNSGCSQPINPFSRYNTGIVNLNKRAIVIGNTIITPDGYEVSGQVKYGKETKKFSYEFGRVQRTDEKGRLILTGITSTEPLRMAWKDSKFANAPVKIGTLEVKAVDPNFVRTEMQKRAEDLEGGVRLLQNILK